MRRVNPRRDAIEYGVLMTLTTTMVAGLGMLLYVNRTHPGGLPKLDLDAPVDFKGAFRELQKMAKGDFSLLNNPENVRSKTKNDDTQKK